MSRLFLANHIELHRLKVGLLLVPKAASTAIRSAVRRSDQAYSTNLQIVRRKYYRIGIVRNTWDRLLAVWHAKTNPAWPWKLSQLHNSEFQSGMDFAPFLDIVARNIEANHHFYPQHKIIGRCHQVWTTDELDAKWLERFPDMPLMHDNVNVLRTRDYRPYYTTALADLVREIYIDEITHFGFEF